MGKIYPVMAEIQSDNKRLTRSLNERIKELSCLYEISKITQNQELDLAGILNSISEVIPSGWQFPNKMGAKIMLDGEQYGSNKNPLFTQNVTLTINSIERGNLTVFYHKNPSKNQPTFIPEEEALIHQIGLKLMAIIDLHEKRENEKRVQQRLRHNDRLNLLGEITAGIAHELNTPLGNILGFSELMLKKEKEPTKINDLKRIVSSSLHARSIVKKLMFFSCEMPSQFKKYDLNKLIKENIHLLQLQLNEKDIQVELLLSETALPTRADAVQFSQILFNLVLNAVSAMDTNGKLKIKTSLEESEINLEISDNGKGMTKETAAKIFQPFYTTKAVGEGTGLGLAVVYGIVQSHGGSITVSSELNKGTTFIIKLAKNEK